MSQEVVVEVEAALLSGSIWLSQNPPRSVILMLPGSGRSTRHNDSLFPVLRSELLEAGHGVASFDKRGVGRSTGDYIDATVDRQAADASRCIDQVQTLVEGTPLGVFGHSQGGWVAFEVAARRSDLAFVISNSGPALGPGPQERDRRLRLARATEREKLGEVFDQLVEVAKRNGSFDDAIATAASIPALHDELAAAGADDWILERALLAYSPASAIERVGVSTLVLHGADDEMIPVVDSAREFDRHANPHIEVEVVAGAGHRFLTSEGRGFVDGYTGVLLGFLDRAL